MSEVSVRHGGAGHELLTADQMAQADRLAIASGVASLTLMENAGRAVADEVRRMMAPGARIAILCGPGNNGGDGFVAARHLKRASYDVRVHLLGDRAALKGDAAEMARRYDGPVRAMDPIALQSMHLVVDALFGAGLTRPLEGLAGEMVAAITASGLPVVAVDVPSGLDATTGQALGPVVQATRTVTFFRKKPGHLLMPGREHCGVTVVAEIGIPSSVLSRIGEEGGDGIDRVATFENGPPLWQACFPAPGVAGHKYSRGHAVVVSGPAGKTGAARLAARGALRIGAGLVTVASPQDALSENAAHLTAIMLMPFEGTEEMPFGSGIAPILRDKRKNAVLVGPGNGIGMLTHNHAKSALASGAAVVLDADAFTAFAGHYDIDLFRAIAAEPGRPVVMTPHEGEFARVPVFASSGRDKLERARAVAKASGAIMVLKGPDTVIAAPDGRAAINANAPPTLATAGSGDVLAGFVTGLLAQSMPAFEAACAAVWLHGEAANRFGPGLVAEDLPEILPVVLADLRDRAS